MEIRPKKSLGQNFLTDQKILETIVDVGKVSESDVVLEVGPGSGNLTEHIIKRKPKKIYVVEKDDKLSLFLKEKFNNQINIINDDILNFTESSISSQKLIVFGNLPYNISSQILSKWIINLDKVFWFKKLILMFQKEVADRIVAKVNTSEYGRLSILTNWKLEVEKIIDINPTCFYPKPKVESSLLVFYPKEKIYPIHNAKNLEKITRIFFNQRRKMIKKPFNQLFNNVSKITNKLNIDLNLRPQNLSPEQYYEITSEYENLGS